MATADHYSLLGVDRDATTAAIKKAYLGLARRHHPDTGGEHALMTWVNLAWATLSDARTRHSYDLTLPGRRSRSSRLHHQTVEKVVRRAAAGFSVQPQMPASPSQWIPEDRSDWYELLGVWSQANRQQMREGHALRLAEFEAAALPPDELALRKQELAAALCGLLDPAKRRAFDVLRRTAVVR